MALQQRGLGRALTSAVDHHQRCVEPDNAIAVHVGEQCRQDLVVVADRPGTHQATVGVDDGDTGRVAEAPREVDAGEVHQADCAAKL